MAEEEAFRSHPYQNRGDRPTIGYGSTYYADGTPVTLDDDPISEPDARALLTTVVVATIKRVRKLVATPLKLTDDQLLALVDFEYNTGGLMIFDEKKKTWHPSGVLRELNSGNLEGAATELRRWVHSGGRVLSGLVSRRDREVRLLLGR